MSRLDEDPAGEEEQLDEEEVRIVVAFNLFSFHFNKILPARKVSQQYLLCID